MADTSKHSIVGAYEQLNYISQMSVVNAYEQLTFVPQMSVVGTYEQMALRASPYDLDISGRQINQYEQTLFTNPGTQINLFEQALFINPGTQINLFEQTALLSTPGSQIGQFEQTALLSTPGSQIGQFKQTALLSTPGSQIGQFEQTALLATPSSQVSQYVTLSAPRGFRPQPQWFPEGLAFKLNIDLPDPIAFWRLDEMPSQTRYDTVTGIGATEVNGPVGIDTVAKFNNAAFFNRTSKQMLVVPTSQSSILSRGPNAVTVAVWTYLPDVADTVRAICFKGTIGLTANTEYWMWIRPGNLQNGFGAMNNASGVITAITGTSFVSRQWYLLWGWYDPSTSKVYAALGDGSSPAPVASAGTITMQATSTPFVIGRYYGNDTDYMYGTLDCLTVWNCVLTPAQRNNFYNAGVGREFYSGSWH